MTLVLNVAGITFSSAFSLPASLFSFSKSLSPSISSEVKDVTTEELLEVLFNLKPAIEPLVGIIALFPLIPSNLSLLILLVLLLLLLLIAVGNDANGIEFVIPAVAPVAPCCVFNVELKRGKL